MGEKTMRARHAFGSEKDIEKALASGSIDAFDILFLNEGKIGWITKQGEPLIIEDKQQIVDDGNAAHGNGAHLAHHDVIQHGDKIGDAVLNDNGQHHRQHPAVKGFVAYKMV